MRRCLDENRVDFINDQNWANSSNETFNNSRQENSEPLAPIILAYIPSAPSSPVQNDHELTNQVASIDDLPPTYEETLRNKFTKIHDNHHTK